MLRALPLLAVLFASAPVLAGNADPAQPQCRHRDEALEKEIGFCQAVRIGNTLHVSGVTGEGQMDAAVRSVYAQLGQILQENGLSWANVVQETVFTRDIDAFIANKGIRKEFYAGALPAATWIQVERMYLPSYVVEVVLTAQYPK